MAYRVAAYPKYPKAWRVIWRKYEKNIPKQRHVPESEYPQLGIAKTMTLEEVKAILKKINLEQIRTDRENSRNLIQIKIAQENEIACIYLPAPLVRKFEEVHLATKYMGNDERLAKVMKLWRAGQKIIRTAINKPVDQWHRYPEPFYAHFQKNKVSPGYAKNIVSIINMWLDFLSFEQDKYYRAIPPPNNTQQSRMNDAFEDADKGKASLPITPEMLVKLKTPMPCEDQFNWLYCSIWAGLRPNEVDALLNPKRTKIRYQDGTPVLSIYQSKLKNVPKSEDRWKYIPLFLPEQVKILDIIESGKIKTPICKTLADRFGKGHTLYGGRKGFHDLMVTRFKQSKLEVSLWLGHQSYNMTLKHYTKKDVVSWVPFKKAA